MSELERLLMLFVAFVAFLFAAYIQGAENGAVLTVYANRYTRKGARSVYMMLTRQARSPMSFPELATGP